MKPPTLPVAETVEAAVHWLLTHGQGVFTAIAWLIGHVYNVFEASLRILPASALIAALAGIATWRASWRLGATVSIALASVVAMNLWSELVSTLALVCTATVLSLLIALPLGIAAARSDKVDGVLRPVLDLMQTMPAFVYLIPAVMFFGLGRVPGVVATVIFATPPAVRLTNLGIRHVPRELVEAGVAFGCNSFQLLVKVQIPTALPTILTGINQNMMLALSMVVIASMIGAGGLGDGVLRGIQRLDVGLGFESGISVVILAIVLDRITQSFASRRGRSAATGATPR